VGVRINWRATSLEARVGVYSLSISWGDTSSYWLRITKSLGRRQGIYLHKPFPTEAKAKAFARKWVNKQFEGLETQ